MADLNAVGSPGLPQASPEDQATQDFFFRHFGVKVVGDENPGVCDSVDTDLEAKGFYPHFPPNHLTITALSPHSLPYSSPPNFSHTTHTSNPSPSTLSNPISIYSPSLPPPNFPAGACARPVKWDDSAVLGPVAPSSPPTASSHAPASPSSKEAHQEAAVFLQAILGSQSHLEFNNNSRQIPKSPPSPTFSIPKLPLPPLLPFSPAALPRLIFPVPISP